MEILTAVRNRIDSVCRLPGRMGFCMTAVSRPCQAAVSLSISKRRSLANGLFLATHEPDQKPVRPGPNRLDAVPHALPHLPATVGLPFPDAKNAGIVIDRSS